MTVNITKPTLGATSGWGTVLNTALDTIVAEVNSLESGTFSPSRVPAAIKAGYAAQGSYDPQIALYQPPNAKLLRTRAGLGRADTLGLFDMTVLGTSLSSGYQATGARAAAWPNQLAALAAARGLKIAGTGFIPASSAQADPRCAASGTFTAFGGMLTQSSTVGDSLTFTPLTFEKTASGVSTTVDFYYDDFSTAQFTIAVNGGAATTITPTNTGTLKVATVTATGPVNTVVVTASTGTSSSQKFNPLGCDIHGPTGFKVNNLSSIGSVSSATYAAQQWSPLSVAAAIATRTNVFLGQTLYVLEQGTNETTGSAPYIPSSFSTNTQVAVSALITGGDVALIAEPYKNTTPDPIPALGQVVYTLADTNGTPVIDFADLLGTYSQYHALGIDAGDGLHFGASGYAVMARAVMGLLRI